MSVIAALHLFFASNTSQTALGSGLTLSVIYILSPYVRFAPARPDRRAFRILTEVNIVLRNMLA